MALTPDQTLADLDSTTPTAEIDNVDNKAQIRSAIGAASTADFVAGAGALTGPAAPLTIGTAAASAVEDFETPSGAQTKVDLVKIYSILAVNNGGSGSTATLTSNAFERIVVPDNTVTIVRLPDGVEADVGRSLIIDGTNGGGTIVDEDTSITQMGAGQVSEFRATSWSGTYLNWSLIGAASGGFDGTTNRITVGGDTDSNLETTISTTGTNETVNMVQLSVPDAVGTTNTGACITPKGTGPVIFGPLPNGGATTGGNARGASAVDLQLVRTAATQVASGVSSFAAGSLMTVSGLRAVGIGYNSTVSGQSSAVIGGDGNTNSGTMSVILAGQSCTVTKNFVLASGYSVKGDRHDMEVRSSIAFSYAGDCQAVGVTIAGASNSTTPKKLLGSVNQEFIIPSGKTYSFTVNVNGVSAFGAKTAHYLFRGQVRNVFRTVSSVDTSADTITFTRDHNIVDDDPIRITSSSTMIAGITEGAVYYAKVIDATTISVHTATPVGAGNIVDITSAGAGNRYMSSTSMTYPPEAMGTNLANGTTCAVKVTPVAYAGDPVINDSSKNLDTLTVEVVGVSGELWRWGAVIEGHEIAYGEV